MAAFRFLSKPRGALVLAAGAAWAVVGGLATAVLAGHPLGWDAAILLFWHRHATPALDRLAVGLTIVGNTGPLVGAGVLGVLALLGTRQRRAAWVFGLMVGGSMLLTQVIKRLVARPRPALWASLRPEHTLSFPSGHAMDTAALAAALLLLAGRRHLPAWLGGWAAAFALAVGWARVYLGVHHPSDVLAGWAAAVGWVLLVQLATWPGGGAASPPAATGRL